MFFRRWYWLSQVKTPRIQDERTLGTKLKCQKEERLHSTKQNRFNSPTDGYNLAEHISIWTNMIYTLHNKGRCFFFNLCGSSWAVSIINQKYRLSIFWPLRQNVKSLEPMKSGAGLWWHTYMMVSRPLKSNKHKHDIKIWGYGRSPLINPIWQGLYYGALPIKMCPQPEGLWN